MNILTIDNITKSYGVRKLFDNAGFYLAEGEKVGIIGINGTGKSTLLKIIAGVEEPDEGKVIKANHCMVRFLPQNPEFEADETVLEAVLRDNKNAENEMIIETDAKSMLTKLGVTDFEQPCGQLSGGQRKRLALVATLLSTAEILVLDEPAAGLDPGGRREILGRIREFQRSSGTSVIIVSHSMEDMAMYCDRIIVMSAGKVAMDGTCSEVFGRYNELLNVGLDVPQITYVADELRKHGIDIGADIYTVKYAASQILAKIGGGQI